MSNIGIPISTGEKKKSSFAPWFSRYKWKNDLMILSSQIIQAVSELYHKKGAAVGAAFRLLRRSFALVGVAGCAWRSSKKVNKCLWKQEREDWKRTQEILTMVHGKGANAKSLVCLQNNEKKHKHKEQGGWRPLLSRDWLCNPPFLSHRLTASEPGNGRKGRRTLLTCSSGNGKNGLGWLLLSFWEPLRAGSLKSPFCFRRFVILHFSK